MIFKAQISMGCSPRSVHQYITVTSDTNLPNKQTNKQTNVKDTITLLFIVLQEKALELFISCPQRLTSHATYI